MGVLTPPLAWPLLTQTMNCFLTTCLSILLTDAFDDAQSSADANSQHGSLGSGQLFGLGPAHSGYPGYTGHPGYPGYSGHPGNQGYTDHPVYPGYSGHPGYPGYSGYPNYPVTNAYHQNGYGLNFPGYSLPQRYRLSHFGKRSAEPDAKPEAVSEPKAEPEADAYYVHHFGFGGYNHRFVYGRGLLPYGYGYLGHHYGYPQSFGLHHLGKRSSGAEAESEADSQYGLHGYGYGHGNGFSQAYGSVHGYGQGLGHGHGYSQAQVYGHSHVGYHAHNPYPVQ